MTDSARPDAPVSKVLRLEEMTMPELDALDRERTLIAIPISPLEAHGPHLPLGTDGFMALDGLIRFQPQEWKPTKTLLELYEVLGADVTEEVRRDDPVALGQLRQHRTPGVGASGHAVQKQQGLRAAADVAVGHLIAVQIQILELTHGHGVPRRLRITRHGGR